VNPASTQSTTLPSRDARLLDTTRVIGQSASGQRLSDHDAYIIEIALD